MASKKYFLLVAVMFFTAMSTFSQVKIGTYYDSTQIPDRRMKQHSEFLSGTYNFPAKPRNQWEIGIKAGLFQVSGDIPAKFLSPGFGLHVRKAFGYVFSMRLEYIYGIGKGQAFRFTNNYAKNPAWGTNITNPGQRYNAPVISATGPGGTLRYVSSVTGQAPTTPWDNVYYNYKTNVQDLSLEGIITLNNVRFHKSKTGFTVYGIAGIGASIYDTKINALDGANSYAPQFNALSQAPYKNRKDLYKKMKDILDDTYETPGENHGERRPKLFGDTFKPSGTVGMGMSFRLNKTINIALEDRWTFIKDDLLDGQRWQEHAWGDAVLTRDFDSYNMLSLGLNINLGGKSVEPLWWLNPLDYAYSEIRNPRLMRLPKPVLPDTDGDGVTDQFDLEQTPANCPVDSHGVTKDTDGDGVPDCKDKELITPTYCQPVDADGIGKCPDPKCCDNIIPVVVEKTCSEKMGALPSVAFKANSNKLNDDAKAVLSTVASKMRDNPGCKVVVVGYCSSNKKEQQLSWDHVNAVINYMVDKEGISSDRFIFNYMQEGGDCNTVDLRAAGEGEDGPNRVEPPHPNLRKN